MPFGEFGEKVVGQHGGGRPGTDRLTSRHSGRSNSALISSLTWVGEEASRLLM
jgi:hypothetical protein